jgi:hypothetical protein
LFSREESLDGIVTNEATLFRSLDTFFDLPPNIQTVDDVFPSRFGGKREIESIAFSLIVFIESLRKPA